MLKNKEHIKDIIPRIRNIKNKLGKTGFFHIFGANTINKMIAFLSSFILVRVLSKSDFGAFSYANNIVAMFMLFSGLGAASATLQLACEKFNEPKKANDIFSYGFKNGMLFNIILMLAILLYALFIPMEIEGSQQLVIALIIMPILVPVYEFLQLYLRYLRKNRTFSYITVANSVLVLVFSMLGAIIWKAFGLIILRYFAYISTITIIIIYLKSKIRFFKQSEQIPISEKKAFRKIATISVLNEASSRLLILLDVFFVGLIIKDSEILASYKVATVIPIALLFIPGALMIYLYPYFVEHKDNIAWVKRNFLKVTKYFLLFNILISAVLFIFAPLIIRLVFGEIYLDSVVPFRLLVLSYLFSASFRKIIGNILVSQRKLKVNLFTGILEGVINIFGNILLINYLGSVGAAISTLSVSVISSAFSLIYFLWYLKNRSQGEVKSGF